MTFVARGWFHWRWMSLSLVLSLLCRSQTLCSPETAQVSFTLGLSKLDRYLRSCPFDSSWSSHRWNRIARTSSSSFSRYAHTFSGLSSPDIPIHILRYDSSIATTVTNHQIRLRRSFTHRQTSSSTMRSGFSFSSSVVLVSQAITARRTSSFPPLLPLLHVIALHYSWELSSRTPEWVRSLQSSEETRFRHQGEQRQSNSFPTRTIERDQQGDLSVRPTIVPFTVSIQFHDEQHRHQCLFYFQLFHPTDEVSFQSGRCSWGEILLDL